MTCITDLVQPRAEHFAERVSFKNEAQSESSHMESLSNVGGCMATLFLARNSGKFRLVVSAIFACLTLGSGIARADTVTYTLTGAGYYAGTSFTYISSAGFLPIPTIPEGLQLIPTFMINAEC